MVSWDKAKGNTGGNTQRREVERLSLQIGDTKVRLIGDVLPRYVYWITTNEGKKMPVECLRFSRATEQFDDTQPDPFKELDEAIFADKPQFAYVCNALDRSDGKIKLFDLRSTIYRQIVDYAIKQDSSDIHLEESSPIAIRINSDIKIIDKILSDNKDKAEQY